MKSSVRSVAKLIRFYVKSIDLEIKRWEKENRKWVGGCKV